MTAPSCKGITGAVSNIIEMQITNSEVIVVFEKVDEGRW